MTTTTPVTPVTLTNNATHDHLSEEDYRDIYDEIRGYDEEADRYAIPLDAFVIAVKSAYSKALWSKYHRGIKDLNRTMKSELRVAVGLAPLPPTIPDIMEAVDPDAHVVRIGLHELDRVILASTEDDPIDIHLNGYITVTSPVTPVTASKKARPKPRKRIWINQCQFERLNTLRQDAGITWPAAMDIIEHELKRRQADTYRLPSETFGGQPNDP